MYHSDSWERVKPEGNCYHTMYVKRQNLTVLKSGHAVCIRLEFRIFYECQFYIFRVYLLELLRCEILFAPVLNRILFLYKFILPQFLPEYR